MSTILGKRTLGSIGAALGAVGVIGVVLTIYVRIHEGRGAEVFQNGYGQYRTWAAYAGCLVAAVLILFGGLVVRWWELWRRSRLEGISMKEIARELKRSAR